MNAEALTLLREPFAAEVVGKLPRVTQKDGPKSRCHDCGGYLPPHIHLDYVSHATVTARLLNVDPLWSWEPAAWTEDGLPLIRPGADGSLILWIKLTICGVTRLGVGSVPAKSFDVEKQLIGDALRNAAMRFGVALDLWAKDGLEPVSESPGLHAVESESPRSTPPPNADENGEVVAVPPAATTRRPPPNRRVVEAHSQPDVEPEAGTEPAADEREGVRAEIVEYARKLRLTKPQMAAVVTDIAFGPTDFDALTADQLGYVYRALTEIESGQRRLVKTAAGWDVQPGGEAA